MTMLEVYQQVEMCRRRLLQYEWTNQQFREEALAAEQELYELEQLLLEWSEAEHEQETASIRAVEVG